MFGKKNTIYMKHFILFLCLLITQVGGAGWEGAVGEIRGIADGSGGSLGCGLTRTPVSPLPARMILTFFPFLKASDPRSKGPTSSQMVGSSAREASLQPHPACPASTLLSLPSATDLGVLLSDHCSLCTFFTPESQCHLSIKT